MKRGELKVMYDGITDEEKILWARQAGYKSYQGLYGYLRNKHEDEAYESVANALVVTIGQDRIDKFICEIKELELKVTSIEENTKRLMTQILISQDKVKLEKIKNDIRAACESQITRIEIENKLGISAETTKPEKNGYTDNNTKEG